jgi:hypothetical protein
MIHLEKSIVASTCRRSISRSKSCCCERLTSSSFCCVPLGAITQFRGLRKKNDGKARPQARKAKLLARNNKTWMRMFRYCIDVANYAKAPKLHPCPALRAATRADNIVHDLAARLVLPEVQESWAVASHSCCSRRTPRRGGVHEENSTSIPRGAASSGCKRATGKPKANMTSCAFLARPAIAPLTR